MGIWKKKDAKRAMQEAVGYDYSNREAREQTVPKLFEKARNERTVVEQEWERYNDYYNFLHRAAMETREAYEERGIPWIPATIPDPYIMVETQICAEVPEPEFRGRDDDQDGRKAKEREYATRFVCENNRLEDKNTSNERRLMKLGDAFWKVYWDNTMVTGVNEGDIRVEDVPVEALYFDPAARERGLQACQYVAHVYRMHKVAFLQTYGSEVERLGLRPEELLTANWSEDSRLFDMTSSVNDDDDTVTVLEWWFRQPVESRNNGKTIPAGVIACSIQVGGKEVKYIPNYWENTWRQNKLFPFVQYWRIRDENSFYNKSELFPIMDLVDAADRKIAMALMNDAMMANDIILQEEGALADGGELSNMPGAVIETKNGRINDVRRLGGLQPIADAQGSINWIVEQIQRANRNFETNQGKETTKQTTASALAMLRQDADEQANIKTADRVRGFERLYELIDWSVQEFYDTDRMIFLGAKKQGEEPVRFFYNSEMYRENMPEVQDLETGEIVREAYGYWPRVDVTVSAGDGIIRGKQATLKVLEGLAQTNVTQANYRILAAELDVLDIPQKNEIIEAWKQMFEAQKAEAAVGMPEPPPELPLMM